MISHSELTVERSLHLCIKTGLVRIQSFCLLLLIWNTSSVVSYFWALLWMRNINEQKVLLLSLMEKHCYFTKLFSSSLH